MDLIKFVFSVTYLHIINWNFFDIALQLFAYYKMPIIKCVYIVEFLFFDPEVSGHYFAMQPDSKFWSDCCIFHSLIPPNAPLPSLIHLCQRLNPVQSDTRACG